MNKDFNSSRLYNSSIFSLMLILMFSNLVSSNVQSTNKPSAPKGCNLDVVQAYGMKGRLIPEAEKIEMCPKVVNSCCEKEDQVIMFISFIHGGQLQAIKDYYSKVLDDYKNLLNTLAKVQEYAANVKANILRKVSNCRLLADRLLNYEAGQVAAQMKENLDKMQEFFTTTYSGFYCALCNHDNHQYFDSTSQTIFFSEKFCRDITQNTLQNLLLFQVDIAKHANLVNRFVSNCDFMGQYNLEAIPPSNLTFTVNNDMMQDLQSCRDNRNKKEWFSYCKEICQNFQLTTYSPYFQPNKELINSFTRYVNSQLNIQEGLRSQKPLLNQAAPLKSSRVLEELSVDIGPKENARVLEEKVKVIFPTGISAKLNLMTFKSDFLSSGISMMDEGLTQAINEATFNSVKTFLQIQNSAKNKNNRKLVGSSSSGIGLLNWLFSVGLLALIKRG